MTITAGGAAIVCGILLGGFGVLGLLITANSVAETNFLIASWLLPITLFPAAALAAALDNDTPRDVQGQLAVLWPAHVGLVLYAAVTGDRWLDASGRGTHENFAALFMLVVLAVHACVFLAGGMALVPFQKTRPAAFQLWLAYPVLLGAWVAGSFLL